MNIFIMHQMAEDLDTATTRWGCVVAVAAAAAAGCVTCVAADDTEGEIHLWAWRFCGKKNSASVGPFREREREKASLFEARRVRMLKLESQVGWHHLIISEELQSRSRRSSEPKRVCRTSERGHRDERFESHWWWLHFVSYKNVVYTQKTPRSEERFPCCLLHVNTFPFKASVVLVPLLFVPDLPVSQAVDDVMVLPSKRQVQCS